jgi:hypothetical protein
MSNEQPQVEYRRLGKSGLRVSGTSLRSLARLRCFLTSKL